MNEELQKELAKVAMDFHLPRYRELPDMGLYLEQVARYVNRYAPAPLTTSMISNYVKQKILPNPVKKVYGSDAIAYLIFLSYVKSVLSLEGIRMLIGVQRSSYPLNVAYDYFCDEFENLLQFAAGLKPMPDRIGNSHTDPKELLRTALLSITYKFCLDEYLRLIQERQEADPQ